MLNVLSNLFVAAVLAGTPLLLGALGEILTGKSRKYEPGCRGYDVHGGDYRIGKFLLL